MRTKYLTQSLVGTKKIVIEDLIFNEITIGHGQLRVHPYGQWIPQFRQYDHYDHTVLFGHPAQASWTLTRSLKLPKPPVFVIFRRGQLTQSRSKRSLQVIHKSFHAPHSPFPHPNFR